MIQAMGMFHEKDLFYVPILALFLAVYRSLTIYH